MRGRRFTAASLRCIQQCVRAHYSAGRTAISVAVCRALRWRQPNGWLKDRACRDVLRRLNEHKLISLPPVRKGGIRIAQASTRGQRHTFQPANYTRGDFELIWAKGNAAESTWNGLVRKHHYLGHKIVVGRCIKYLVTLNQEVVAAISFSSPAWELEQRNLILAEIGIPPWETRDAVINNSRYVILCEKGVTNLASNILALASSRVASDWEAFYAIRPLVIETFVEPSRFYGTCYKAANWVHVGMTKGYRKVGNTHTNSQEPKSIYMYGLDHRMRRLLTAYRAHTMNES